MLDFATNAARSVLGVVGVAEHRVEGLGADANELRDTVAAIHRSAESVERHAEVLAEVADALPALTESMTRLSDQLSALLVLATPVEAVERDVKGVRRLFHRRRRPAAAPALMPPPSAPADGSGSSPR
jgi:hypothetical protein